MKGNGVVVRIGPNSHLDMLYAGGSKPIAAKRASRVSEKSLVLSQLRKDWETLS